MKQLTLVEPGRVEWTDEPEPKHRGCGRGARPPARGGALRPRRQHRERRVPAADAGRARPRVRGRGGGRGGRRNGARPGDRVVVPFQISCGECARCRRGQTGDCESVPRLSMYGFGAFGGDWGGALERPGARALRGRDAGSASRRRRAGRRRERQRQHPRRLADGVRRTLDRRPGAEVLVVSGGARSIGLYAVDAALALGAAEVVYVDDDESRLRVGRGAGRRDGRRRAAAPRRAFPDHRQREPDPRGPPLRDPLDRARGRLHERRVRGGARRRRCRCSRCTRTGSSSASAG